MGHAAVSRGFRTHVCQVQLRLSTWDVIQMHTYLGNTVQLTRSEVDCEKGERECIGGIAVRVERLLEATGVGGMSGTVGVLTIVAIGQAYVRRLFINCL